MTTNEFPKTLYKYYPCNQNSFKSFARNGLYCGYAVDMNDPAECLSGSELLYNDDDLAQISASVNILAGGEGANADLKEMLPLDNSVALAAIRINRNLHIKTFSFCALSEKPDDMLMWSHYANEHRGCVIGFVFPDDIGKNLQPVEYADAPKKLDTEIAARLISAELQNEDEYGEVLKNITIKADCWKYEKEWRLWRSPKAKKDYFYYTIHDNDKLPYIESIIFGVRCNEDVQLAVLKCLGLSYDPKDYKTGELPIYQMEMRYDPLELEPVRCSPDALKGVSSAP